MMAQAMPTSGVPRAQWDDIAKAIRAALDSDAGPKGIDYRQIAGRVSQSGGVGGRTPTVRRTGQEHHQRGDGGALQIAVNGRVLLHMRALGEFPYALLACWARGHSKNKIRSILRGVGAAFRDSMLDDYLEDAYQDMQARLVRDPITRHIVEGA